MKKVFLLAIMLLFTFTLTSCDSLFSIYEKSEWYTDGKLSECEVPNLPEFESNIYLKENDDNIYVTMSYIEFNNYCEKVYDYLKSINLMYLGTRGELDTTLAGALTTYFFSSAETLEEFINDDGWVRFVYSTGQYDENGDVIFNIFALYNGFSNEIEYRNDTFVYNTRMYLKRGSESKLSGFYKLP